MAVLKWGLQQSVSASGLTGQADPVTAPLSDGGYVVIWDDNRYTGVDAELDVIRGQRYGADGAAVGSSFVVSTTNIGLQRSPSVATLSNGSFVVVWEDVSATGGDTSGLAVRGRLYDAAGTPQGDHFVMTTTTTGNQNEPSVAALDNGGFVVTWTDASGSDGDASGTQIRAQVFDAAGAPDGTEFRVNEIVTGDQLQSTVTRLDGGGFAVAWTDDSQTSPDTTDWAVRVAKFDAFGNQVGIQRLVNTTYGYDEGTASIAGLDNGGFVVAWSADHNNNPDNPAGQEVYFQTYDVTGAAVGSNVKVNGLEDFVYDRSSNYARQPSVVGLKDGGFLIAWNDFGGTPNEADCVRAIQYSETGVRLTEFPLVVNTTTVGSQGDPHLSLLSDGRVIAAFENVASVSAQLLDPRDGIVNGTDKGEHLYGNDVYNDVMWGVAGDDFLFGLFGNDMLDGGTGADTMNGGYGDDAYIVDNTGDVLLDPGGVDTAWSSVSRTLGYGVEHLALTGAAAIRGTGNASANRITGNDAVNVLTGLGGNDTLRGNGSNDQNFGGAGNDSLYGGLGNDKLLGDAGNDILKGDAGNDILIGGANKDTMTGGAGLDDFDFDKVTEIGIGGTRDRITDLVHVQDDIDLSTIDAKAGVSGNNSFKFIGAQAFHNVTGELHYFRINATGTANDKTIVEGDINGDGRADFQIELTGLKTLSAGDFIL